MATQQHLPHELSHLPLVGAYVMLQRQLARDVTGPRFHALGSRVVVDEVTSCPDAVELQCMSITDAVGPHCAPMSQNVLVCSLSRYLAKLSMADHLRPGYNWKGGGGGCGKPSGRNPVGDVSDLPIVACLRLIPVLWPAICLAQELGGILRLLSVALDARRHRHRTVWSIVQLRVLGAEPAAAPMPLPTGVTVSSRYMDLTLGIRAEGVPFQTVAVCVELLVLLFTVVTLRSWPRGHPVVRATLRPSATAAMVLDIAAFAEESVPQQLVVIDPDPGNNRVGPTVACPEHGVTLTHRLDEHEPLARGTKQSSPSCRRR